MPTAQQTYMILENQTLWEATKSVHELLALQSIPHAIIGGIAVCLHGYRRNTIDIDLLVRPQDSALINSSLTGKGWSSDSSRREFQDTNGIAVHFVMAGHKPGPGQPTVYPDPADPKAVTTIEALPVLTLPALIQSKIACGLANLRRTHKDFADVVELIITNELDHSFAQHLDPSVRPEFKELVRRANS